MAKTKAGGKEKDKQGSGAADNKKDGKMKGAQSINVRHILCAKESKINEAQEKLNAGAKFDDVAREFSEDKARTGGALGWKLRGDLLPAFADAAFALDTSTTAKPIVGSAKTSEGYHLIMVEQRK